MAQAQENLTAAQHGDSQAFAQLVAPFRRELRAHCYRMSGSIHDADDLLQESLLRVWKGLAGFEGRSAFRTWLYRVTTSACLDVLESKAGRRLPTDLGPAATLDTPMSMRPEPIWLEPCPEALYAELEASPEARYGRKESVALAFLVALQLLPPKQRAVVILRDVLGWQASECAELLGLSVAAVNSALQRGRETLEARAPSAPDTTRDADVTKLLKRYVEAWELADSAALVSLLHEDATLLMPPLEQWLQGASTIGASLDAMVFRPGLAFRLLPIRANGVPAFAAYQRDPQSGEMRPRALHLLNIDGDRIRALDTFLDVSLFPLFGLPATV